MIHSTQNTFQLSILNFLILLVCCSLGWSCSESASDQVQVWVLHDIPDLANIEMVNGDQVLLEISPGELTQVSMPLQETQLQFRNSGSPEVLLTSSLINFENQAYFFALRGSMENELSLVEVQQPITRTIGADHHSLTLLNLADPNLAFTVYQDTQAIAEVQSAEPDLLPQPQTLSIQVGQNRTLSTNHLPNSESNVVVGNFFANEASLLVIQSQPNQSMPEPTSTLSLELISLSISSSFDEPDQEESPLSDEDTDRENSNEEESNEAEEK